MIKDAVVRVVRLKEKAGKGKRAGMTMIEVLIVVAVLAVIGAAVMPRFNTYIENSRYATAESDLDAIMTAVSATYSQVGSFGTVSGGDLDSPMGVSDMTSAGFTVEYNFQDKQNQPAEGLKITFPAEWMAQHNGDFIITYQATVNSDMSVSEGAENSAYTNVSTTDSTVSVDYSNLDIVKTGSDSGNPQLAGAEFKIYRTMSQVGDAAPTFGDPVLVGEGTELVLTTLAQTGSDGLNVTANGAYFLDPAETYYVVETKAPAEYMLPDNGGLVAIIGANASEDYNELVANQTLVLDVENTHSEDGEGVDLPVTGGAGTVALTAAGVVLVAGAAAFIVRSRKQN